MSKVVLLMAITVVTVPLARAHAEEQPHGVLRGVVVDEASHRPIPGATVILMAPTSKSGVTAARTDAAGRFQISELPGGTYRTLTVLGAARTVTAGIVVGVDETVEIEPVLAVDPEVITIHEKAPSVTIPKAIPSTVKRILPYSDKAIETNAWAVGWMLLEIDPKGLVTGFRFLHKPGHDLEELATREVWTLRFKPAVDENGQPVASELLWKMEWPAYWWYQEHIFRPTPSFLPVQPNVAQNVPIARRPFRGAGEFMLPDDEIRHPRLPPCSGGGPLGNHSEYRDCSAPDLDMVDSELITPHSP